MTGRREPPLTEQAGHPLVDVARQIMDGREIRINGHVDARAELPAVGRLDQSCTPRDDQL